MKKDHDRQYIEVISRFLSSLDSIKDDGACSVDWRRWRQDLRDAARTQDMREFLSHRHILAAMNAIDQPYIENELRYLKSLKNWHDFWLPALREDVFGSPKASIYLMNSSANLIHHGFHAARFQEETGLKIKDFDYIVEFGGGYGSFCRLTHNVGFNGRYVIFDLPEYSCLQEFYLSGLGFSVSRQIKAVQEGEICCTSDIAFVEEILNGRGFQGKKGLFVATWSLSETPLEVRAPIEPLLKGCTGILIAYQRAYGEIDNDRYFIDLAQRSGQRMWRQLPTIDGNSAYMFGSP